MTDEARGPLFMSQPETDEEVFGEARAPEQTVEPPTNVAGGPLLEPHDGGCQCWPHVAQGDAFRAVEHAALMEYRSSREAAAVAAPALDVLDWLIGFDWLVAHENHTLHFGRDHGGGAHIRCASPDGGYLRIAIPSRLSQPSPDEPTR